MFTIHHLNNSRSQRILWMCELLNLDYEIKVYQRDAQTNLAPSSLQQIHPLGTAPLLNHKGNTIAETGAICEYISKATNDESLIPPKDHEDFIDVPAERLLDSIYLRERMNDFQKYHATKSSSVGSGDIDIKFESFETTHTSVVDSDGMAVSVTTTLNLIYGSKVLVNGAGFFLNNEMDDFSAKPGVANFFGLIGNEANAIAPQKRMLSSMTPTIIEQDGKAKLVLGTPGGSTIITSVFQVIMNVLEFDMTLDEAVYAPRFHHQWLPDKIMTEKDMWNRELTDSLRNRGHELGSYDRIGLVKAIEITTDGTLIGVGDHRSDDHASGY